jgi:Helicase conserved C-terminal domain
VLFNGSNSTPQAREIYKAWKEKHADSDKVTGSRTADTRAALVDYFRNEADIMIATEAAAEGINLQFCSLVVNYDLPWNPQRIEQRIGRCHRYGQKHDVVVVNFLNKKNAADQRVYQLLSEKFKLFDGVFGASDEVLGSIESGVDFEKRIVEIYQTCRTSEEIQLSFDTLQADLSTRIDENMKQTRKQLLEHFDEEVHEKLRVNMQDSKKYLNKHETFLWELTRYALQGHADFDHDNNSFLLQNNPFPDLTIPVGPYEIGRKVEEAHIYRPSHPLAQRILTNAAGKELETCKLTFNYTDYAGKISILEPLIGRSGTLAVYKMMIESLEAEDYLISVAQTDEGELLDEEQCARLFSLPAENNGAADVDASVLDKLFEQQQAKIIDTITSRNAVFFDEEIGKLENWADDQKATLEFSIKELDKAIKLVRREAKLTVALEEKLTAQRKIKKLEQNRNQQRKQLFEHHDIVDAKRDELIDDIEMRLKQKISSNVLFTVEWNVV